MAFALLEVLVWAKTVAFVLFCSLIFVNVCLWVFFDVHDFFVKKINKLEIILIASIHYTTVRSLTNFKPINFEKIYYKLIPLCSCVWFKLSFKASESLKLLILPCRALNVASKKFILDFKALSVKKCWGPASTTYYQLSVQLLILMES